MPAKAQRCLVEIDVKSVTCSGTWLPNRDDVYLSVSLFGQVRQTSAADCTFPLLFNDDLLFDRVFKTAYESSQVVDALEDFKIKINLIQLSDTFSGGRLLAYHESNARDFLYPYSSRSNSYSVRDRELLLERTATFPGVNPRLEFSTRTVIEDILASDRELLETELPCTEEDEDYGYSRGTARQSRSQTRYADRMSAHDRQIVRYKSPSPSMRNQIEYHDFYDRGYCDQSSVDHPSFARGEVGGDFIGRRPRSKFIHDAPLNRIYRDPIPMDPVGWERGTAYQRRSATPSRNLSKLRDQYDLQFDDQYRNPQHRMDQYPSRNGGRLYRNRSFNHPEQSKAYRGHMNAGQW